MLGNKNNGKIKITKRRMRMVRKKYRKINAKNFVAICDMPLMETRSDVIEWMKNGEFMYFIFWKACNQGAIVLIEDPDLGFKWQGTNYKASENDYWDPEDVNNGWQLNLNEALVKDEIDLMPPLYNKLPNERYDLEKSEVIKFLKTKKHIFDLLFVAAGWNGYLVNDNGHWVGKNLLKETNANKCSD
ncbi:hypothetical protein [Enterococcus xiangfangensis]|uniref:DUF2750 domain-containing protein n=1 Tax=Enterococcus xiangfangensis TaxID=1296537 RepID=A0ABU3FCT0_9ENTE|nr:hypothetical protein [Enterococcus xiangfangensis]MDT2760482.1 hypothetical protein [Enterococcus xiangfangensis]